MAGFNTAVTGLKSSSTLLDVAGNNIANSSTVGFKATRTEFADIFATSVVGAGASNQPGSGVTVSDTSQDFSAGTIEFTNNNLDLAINGSGFFQLNDGQGGITYTRAGAFELDKDGFIVSKNGKFLQGYGLDALGNQLPLQNLSVTQKESPPKATETIDLSFNIDSSADATKLAREFDRTNPASYTYSTTVETVDSLGNSNSIRFYTVEQAPVRERHSFTVTPTGALNDLTVGDFTFTTAELADLPNLPVSRRNEFAVSDPRIDPDSIAWDGTNFTFEVFAQYSNYGDFVVQSDGDDVVDVTAGFPIERPANEMRTFTINTTGSLFSGTPATIQEDVTITIGDINVLVEAGSDVDDIGAAVEAAERDILNKYPDIESVAYEDDSIVLTWKPEVGFLKPSDFNVSLSPETGVYDDLFTTVTVDSVGYLFTKVDGDNTYQANYLMYAYLNDETAVNIGKPSDPGEPGADTEVGPIIIGFDSTTGVLNSVNGVEANGGLAPNITILGADPANPNDEILAADVDSLAGIQLNITGSSQFASESIVKSAAQDGYPKGDLIGVTFAETGEMVASFSNGQRQNLGLVAIASFENQDGLRSSGNSEWIATLNSGAAILNPPGTGLNGTLRSAALEQSNVDLSAELVKLIEGQRNFQANSKTLETLNTVTQAILQI